MNIRVNGEVRAVAAGCTIAQLIGQLGLAGQRLAVEINEEIVPRSAHDRHVLAEGDRVEIVHAIGGG
ncbi:MAG: sulfur carrier protein ThiS [Pseudomonadota bacterium]